MTKRKKGKKRGRPPGSRNKPTSTVSDAMAKRPAPKLIACEFCGYEFDEACGRYGCPNCNGEGLDPVKQCPRCGVDVVGETQREKVKAHDAILLALVAINADPARPVVRTFPVIPTFGSDGARHDLAVVLEDSAWSGHCLMTDGDKVWLEPYEG